MNSSMNKNHKLELASVENKPGNEVLHAPDEGFFFEWDSKVTAHNQWFKTYVGTEDHLHFQPPPAGPGQVDTLLASLKLEREPGPGPADDLPMWKGALISILRAHPLGISQNQLQTKLKSILSVEHQEFFPYKTFEELLTNESDLIVAKTFKFPGEYLTLCFSKNKATANPDFNLTKLTARLCHQLKVVVSLNGGMLKTSDFFPLLKSLRGLRLDPEDWDFEGAESLTHFLLLLVPQTDIQSVSLTQIGEYQSECREYLVMSVEGCSPEISKILAEDQQLQKVMTANQGMRNIWKKRYVRLDSHLPHASSFIEETENHECCFTTVFSPSNFYVHLVENWNQMETFQECFGKFYEGKDVPPTVPKKYLVKGMHVAVFVRQEWHRGIIKKVNAETGECRIFLTEFGDEISEDGSKLRLLPKKMFNSFWAQAIRCRLRFHEGAKNYLSYLAQSGKSKLIRKVFLDIVTNKTFSVHFHRRFRLNEDDSVWEVDMICCAEGKVGENLELNPGIMEGQGDGLAHLLIHKLAQIEPVPSSIVSDDEEERVSE